jgi:hypothetical protein
MAGSTQLYEVRYTRDRKEKVELLPHAQALVLAGYLKRTFRIDAEVRRAA